MDIKELQEVRQEMKRLDQRITLAIERLKNDGMATITGCKETGAVRRSAMDLKRILTKIT